MHASGTGTLVFMIMPQLHRNLVRMGQLFRLILLACISLGAATSASALTYDEDEFTCPIGGEVFTSIVVGSSSQFGVRLDLKPQGALLAPLPVPVCPGNGFVMYKEVFSSEELAKLAPIVESEAYQAARKQNTDYYMMAYLLERLDPDALQLAHIYLKASWEAEEKLPDRMARYHELALTKFKAYLKTQPSQDESWWVAQIAAANLERRIGQHSSAIARISALPLDEGETRTEYSAIFSQIKSWAERGDTGPQDFKPEQ